MKEKDPRGNAGRGIETSNSYDSTAARRPLSAIDQEARPRVELRDLTVGAI
jgi:hypothetical protein